MIGIYIFVAVLVWTLLSLIFREKKAWKLLNGSLCFLYIICVIYVTLLSRTGDSGEISWIPFQSLFLAAQYPDIYNQIAMNILMFVPIGLTMPNAICGLNRHCVRFTIISCCLFSLCIELCQYFFGLGRCEIDDIIMNTIGAVLGTTSFLLYRWLKNRFKWNLKG